MLFVSLDSIRAAVLDEYICLATYTRRRKRSIVDIEHVEVFWKFAFYYSNVVPQ
jgi:hypothetical protein